ncbi:restriction endonuclease subunit S domain-containing protein [Klebsiella oxytoca]|uniref:restriction endonuclease subunit S n=1 Tax=Klebsiella oxytoca TaxID=571 RepID=UPI001C9DACF0|nr:restriction endonuclease subunit S [Klebsiella oxytoca]
MKNVTLMHKYEAYQNSGVEWLGDIPDSWSLLANKYIFKLKKSLVGKKSDDYELLSLTLKGIIKRDMNNPEGKFPADFNTYQEVKKDDFVFCLFDVEETPRTVGLSLYDGMITGAYTVFETTKDFNNKFLYYFYLNLDSNKRLKPLYRGLRNTIPKESFMGLKTFVPRYEQQYLIASYLDKKTTQIDDAIAIKEQEINLLKERKQIIIQKAVTQGLDPNVTLKESGVDWVGKIPENWEIKRAKYIFKKEGRSVRSEDDVITCFRDGQVTLRKNRRTEGFTFAAKEHGYQGIRKGDLVIHAMDAFAGAIGVSDSDGKSSPVYSVCTPFQDVDINVKYYALYLRNLALGGFIESLAKGIRERSTDFRYNDFAELFLPMPDKETQDSVVLEIEKKSLEIDCAINLLKNQMEKLKEYKATLINSAVTGKIKITPSMVEQ